MDKIVRGILKYNASSKAKYVADMEQYVHQQLKPLTVFFSCMDARVLPSRFSSPENGQVFIVRNAGNMVPDFEQYSQGMINTEGAALELGCVVNEIDNVVVCGHSDCKAANLLYDLRHDCDYKRFHLESPLKTWVSLHGKKTVDSYQTVANADILVCSFHIGNQNVTAHIDPENHFDVKDKFSQIHCLQQASHVSTYPFLKQRLQSGAIRVFAMWFDIHKGDVYLFSPKLKRFLTVKEGDIHEVLN